MPPVYKIEKKKKIESESKISKGIKLPLLISNESSKNSLKSNKIINNLRNNSQINNNNNNNSNKRKDSNKVNEELQDSNGDNNLNFKVLNILSNTKYLIDTEKIKKSHRRHRGSVLLKLVHHISEHHSEGNKIEENQDKAKFWLAFMSLMSRISLFYILSKPCELNTPEALSLLERKRKSARFIVRFLKHKSNWFHRRIKKRFEFLHKHGWRLILYAKCFLRRKAITLVRSFFSDFAALRLPYIMMKYRTNAVHLQRFVRSYVLITRARIAALLLKWQQIETNLRTNLIPNLLVAIEKEYEMKQLHKESDEGVKWKKVKLDGVVFPQLAHKVNRATKATIKLTHTMSQGERKMRSYQLPPLPPLPFSPLQQQSSTNSSSSSCPILPPLTHPQKSNSGIDENEEKYSDLTSSKSEDSLTSLKRTKEKVVLTSYHTAPFRYLKRSPQDIGLKPSHPLSQKAKERIIASYLYDCRIMFKRHEQEKRLHIASKKKSGLTVEEVKHLLSNENFLQQYAEQISSSQVFDKDFNGLYPSHNKISLLIFTGENALLFYQHVENDLRREYGLSQ